MTKTRNLTIGQMFGCGSMMFAKVMVRFMVSEDGTHSVANMEELPFLVRKNLNWEKVCEELKKTYANR